MPKFVKSRVIKFDKKVAGGVKLPRTLVLYAVDAGHFVLSVKPLESLEEAALIKTRVSVAVGQDKYLIKLPSKIYNFYQMDESDYMVMASDKDPGAIIITV
ncbi:MAG: hypothetical protein ABSA75_05875 [Candidatus Bathyarchaeia archaeon]|jgi:hypothetical protein